MKRLFNQEEVIFRCLLRLLETQDSVNKNIIPLEIHMHRHSLYIKYFKNSRMSSVVFSEISVCYFKIKSLEVSMHLKHAEEVSMRRSKHAPI